MAKTSLALALSLHAASAVFRCDSGIVTLPDSAWNDDYCGRPMNVPPTILTLYLQTARMGVMSLIPLLAHLDGSSAGTWGISLG